MSRERNQLYNISQEDIGFDHQKAKELEELKECTFTPNIHKTLNSTGRNISNDYDFFPSKGEVFNRLHEVFISKLKCLYSGT